MGIKEFFKNLYFTLNPDRYQSLITNSIKDTLQYFFGLVLLGMLLMMIFSVPALINLKQNIESNIQKFDTLEFNAEVSQSEVVKLSDSPEIVVDMGGEIDGERMFVNNESISVKLFPLYSYQILFSDFENGGENSEKIAEYLTIIGVLLIPSLLVVFYLWFSIKYLLLAILFSVISWAALKATKYRLKYNYLIKLSLFATTFIIIPESILFPFQRLTWIPVVLYLIVGGIVVVLNSEKKIRHPK